MGRARGAVVWVSACLLVALWPQCCWVGRLAARTTASTLAALLLEIFMSLDQTLSTPRGQPGRSSRCEDVSLRVSKGLGSRGYGAVRVSAVCRLPQDVAKAPCPAASSLPDGSWAESFDHCGRFQHRWTDFHLSTSLVELLPGSQTLQFNHTAGPLQLNISLPPQGAGVHGIVIGDPCISSRYIPGLCNRGWDVLGRLPLLLDLVNSVDPLDFVVILGDAFYDMHGGLTAEFWRRLSRRSQQVFVIAVPGNHDFWMFAPQATVPQDQLGFGFAQWYAQDTASSGPAGLLSDRMATELFTQPLICQVLRSFSSSTSLATSVSSATLRRTHGSPRNTSSALLAATFPRRGRAKYTCWATGIVKSWVVRRAWTCHTCSRH